MTVLVSIKISDGVVMAADSAYLDQHFDAWLGGSPTFVSAYQLMNGLGRVGALAPGEYGLSRSN